MIATLEVRARPGVGSAMCARAIIIMIINVVAIVMRSGALRTAPAMSPSRSVNAMA